MGTANVRVIKTIGGRIIVQHRLDGIYNDGNLPVPLGIVVDQAELESDDTDLLQVEETDAQMDVSGGTVGFNLAGLTRHQRKNTAVINAVGDIDDIDGWVIGEFTHAYVKTFLEAFGDMIAETRTGGPVPIAPFG